MIQGTNYKYIQYNTNETSSITFYAKAASDVRIGLLTQNVSVIRRGEPLYEIVIGARDNKDVLIWRKAHSPAMALCTPKYTSLTTRYFRAFWVEWTNYQIAVGRGKVVGRSTFCALNSSSSLIEVNFIAFAMSCTPPFSKAVSMFI